MAAAETAVSDTKWCFLCESLGSDRGSKWQTHIEQQCKYLARRHAENVWVHSVCSVVDKAIAQLKLGDKKWEDVTVLEHFEKHKPTQWFIQRKFRRDVTAMLQELDPTETDGDDQLRILLMEAAVTSLVNGQSQTQPFIAAEGHWTGMQNEGRSFERGWTPRQSDAAAASAVNAVTQTG